MITGLYNLYTFPCIPNSFAILQIQNFHSNTSFAIVISFLLRTGPSQVSSIDSKLDEIDTLIRTQYYRNDGQEKPNMIFSMIGDSNNLVPIVWPKSRLQGSLTYALRATGSMLLDIGGYQFTIRRKILFLS